MASTWPSIIWMAKKSNSFVATLRSRAICAASALGIAVFAADTSSACPFCTALGPSLCQQREQATIAALAELEGPATGKRSNLRLHRVLEGAALVAGKQTLELEIDVTAKPGGLLLVFGNGPPDAPLDKLTWHAVLVDETSYAYFARAPSSKTALLERLRYFVPFLEHRDPLIAEDAYLEFGHAPFDQVASLAEILPLARLRDWLTDPQVRPAHKGFYGLALGLAGDAPMRRANAEFLRKLILAPDNDFRAGFDGILGGYLLLAGSGGLELVESRYLSNPRAADGDVRHALTALRFYHEYGHEIPVARQQSALRQLLARPEFSEAAITDLARWKDWDAVDRIAGLYVQPAYAQPATRRAIVGYLLACPTAKASAALAQLRQNDPRGVAAAEEILSRTTSVPQGAQ
jgi:hypothetical protein